MNIKGLFVGESRLGQDWGVEGVEVGFRNIDFKHEISPEGNIIIK